MPIRTRKFIGVAALVVGALFGAYLLFGWFGFEPLVKWGVPKLVLDRSGRHLTMEGAAFDPLRLSVEVRGLALTEPNGKPLLRMKRLFVDADAAGLWKRTYVFDEIRLTEPVVALELRADGGLNWLDFIDALAGPRTQTAKTDSALPRLLLRRCVLERGRINLADERVRGGFRTQVEPLSMQLDNLSTLPEDRGDYSVSAQTGIGATVRWKGEVGLNPVTATGDIAVDGIVLDRLWPYLRDKLDMAPPTGTVAFNLAYRASYADRHVDLVLERIGASVDKLALRGTRDAEPSIALDALRVTGGRFDLAQQALAFDGVSVTGGRVDVELDPAGRPQMLDWIRPSTPPPPAAAASAPGPAASAPAAAPWRVAVAQVAVDRLAVGVVDHGFVTPLAARVGALQLRLKAGAEFGAGAPRMNIDDVGATLADIGVSSDAHRHDWLRVPKLEVQHGRIDVAGRALTLGRIALTGGLLEATREAGGELRPLVALQRRVGVPKPPSGAVPASGDDRPWRYHVDKVDAQGFGLALRDESVTPAVRLDIEALSAAAEGLSENLKTELPVQLQFRVKQGGSFQAKGQVSPAAPSADLSLKLADLDLTPAQPILARSTNLILARGKVSTQGRLRYQQGKATYDGDFAVRTLKLNEAATNDLVLGWKSLSTRRLTATQQRLRVADLVLDGMDGKLVIFKDRTVNIGRLLKPATGPAAARPTGTQRAGAESPPYRVDIDRLRLTRGEMDFADLSLALPFGARIHELQGHLVGLSTRSGPPAQLEFEGKVDDYGLARAAGQINLFDPTGFTDIKVAFRNVEMTTLTPYSATFAGRKIESGKLSLDLEYKIKDRQLAGDNQIVMNKLRLGERVESPTAVNLPLDLAIAILQDADGTIDLGLPVSGSLDDPQFSYGQIVWKAIVNVLTKIVTAPFRALGAMLGVSGEKLDTIAFDAGSAVLLPPEREKLANVAKLMVKRPGIGLSVRADFDPKADAQAIRSLRLRRAVAQESGRSLSSDTEDPGPVAITQPETRQALERLYVKRFGAGALETLQQRHRQANPEPAPPTAAGRAISKLSSLLKAAPEPLSAEETARLRGADVHALMLQRLLDEEVVIPAQLRELAAQRAESIRRELAARTVAPDRVSAEEPRAHDSEHGAVTASLGIGAGAAKGMVDSSAASAPANAASSPVQVPAR